MSGRVESDPEAVRRVGFAVDALEREVVSACARAQSVMQRTLQELQDELRQREKALERAKADLRESHDALEACLADRRRSCGREADAVTRGRELMSRRERQLQTSREALNAAKRMDADVHQAARRLLACVRAGREHARRFLAGRGAALDGYLAASTAAIAGPAPASSRVSLSSGSMPTHEERRPGPPADGPASDPRLSALGPPDMYEVPLAGIEDGDSHVQGPASFQKATATEMRQGLTILREEVLPWVRRGGSAGELSVDGRRVHGYFFGDTCVKLQRGPDGTLSVVNGYHRIHVAREMGFTSLPARVL